MGYLIVGFALCERILSDCDDAKHMFIKYDHKLKRFQHLYTRAIFALDKTLRLAKIARMFSYRIDFIKMIIISTEEIMMDHIKRDYFTYFLTKTKFSKWPLSKRTGTAKTAGKTRNRKRTGGGGVRWVMFS